MKKRLPKPIMIPIFLLLSITLWIITYSPIKNISSPAENGIADLSAWNRDSVVSLPGNWRYYPNALISDIHSNTDFNYITVPHFFESSNQLKKAPYGTATYGLTIKGLTPNTIYGLQVFKISSAYRVTVNGENILSAGNVAKKPELHIPEMKEKVGYFRSDEHGVAEVFIEISNYSFIYGGFWEEIKVGTVETMESYASHQDGIQIFLFALTFIMGMYYYALYVSTLDFKPILYFSTISFLVSLRIILTDNRQFFDFIYNLSWNAGMRLQYLEGFLLLPFFILFFHSLGFTKPVKQIYTIIYIYISAIVIMTLFTPVTIYGNFHYIYVDLCIASIPFFAYVVYQGLRKKMTGARLLLIGTSGFVVATLIEFFVHPHNGLIPFGMFFMLVCFSVIVNNLVFKMKEEHDYLEKAISVDTLTGLKNRYFLNHLLHHDHPIFLNKQFYVLFFDLDRFKPINDTYGHDAGDVILKQSAIRLQSCFHSDSDIVCRYGGDEFIAFVAVEHGSEEMFVQEMLKRVTSRFSEPFIVKGNSHALSISVGVSLYQLGDDLEDIIKKSDEAMYTAKKAKKGGLTIVNGIVKFHQES